ncbi:MAG: xylose isomerase [Planctomycetes bacterium]|nr:xylose isomerase [Planctomycetota bacterium]
MRLVAVRFRIGYCTSGLQGHRLDDALRLLADLGYRGIFLTLDVHHLDPMAPDLPARVAHVRGLLEEFGITPVVETGARFLLDRRRKHWPTLLSRDGADRRERFLVTALEIARDLGATCISTWSGANADALPADEAHRRLTEGFERLLAHAERTGVDIAFEPEPGMLVETVADFHRLREDLGRPERLKLSLDCGHLLVTGEDAPHVVVRRERELLACVAIEDMRRGVHEHLPFGEGDLDLPALISALSEIAYEGVVAVELGRHSHEGPAQAKRSKAVLAALGVPFGKLRTP